MTLPVVPKPEAWRHPDNLDAAVQHLLGFAAGEGIDVAALSKDPYAVLEAHPTITIRHSLPPSAGCSVFGHYTPKPPTIHVVQSATVGRDEFTLLHEYAHHLQKHDMEWADVEWRIEPESFRRRITEDVADTFASTVLIPEQLAADLSRIPTSRQIADMHIASHASRQAAIVRAAKRAQRQTLDARSLPTEHFFITLARLDGTVVFSQMVGDDLFPPPRGSHQPDIATAATRAVEGDGHASLATSHGIIYGSGATRSDIRLDAHVAYDGDYLFAVGTREHRYGNAQWGAATYLCASPACDTEFVYDDTIATCRKCLQPKCPTCRTCQCPPTVNGVCPKCQQVLTAADKSAGRTEHDECW